MGRQMLGWMDEQVHAGWRSEWMFKWVHCQMCRGMVAWIGRGKDEQRTELQEQTLAHCAREDSARALSGQNGLA